MHNKRRLLQSISSAQESGHPSRLEKRPLGLPSHTSTQPCSLRSEIGGMACVGTCLLVRRGIRGWVKAVVGFLILLDGSQSFELKNNKNIGFTVSSSY